MDTINQLLPGWEGEVLRLMAAIILASLTVLLNKLRQKYSLNLTDAQSAALETVAGKALAFGVQASLDLIKKNGWDDITVKNAVTLSAAAYAVNNFPDVLKASGIDVGDVSGAIRQLSNTILERKFPEVATIMAASPTTPPAPPLTTIRNV